ncbi:MAG: hypothetical protein ACODAE_08080, partial [Gemmatimonadota bacterium]
AAETFLQLDPPLDSVFIREQIAKWARNARRGENAPREGYEFYDVTAWSLPVAFGVDAWALESLPDVQTEPVRPAGDGRALAGSGYWADELAFDPGLAAGVRGAVAGADAADGPAFAYSAIDERGGRDGADPVAVRARSAYVWTPDSEGAIRLAARLMREGFEVATSTGPLVVGERDFPRGSFVARVSRNPDRIHERIDALARDAGVPVVATHTAFAARGDTGTGSNAVLGLDAPRVAVIADEGVRVTEYGAVWFTLERRLGYSFTPLRIDGLLRTDLDDYDVIVLPSVSAEAVARALDESGVDALEGWMRRGGTLITWGGGARFAMDRELTTASIVDPGRPDSARVEELIAAIDALPQDRGPAPPITSPTANPAAPQPVPGANLLARLDLTHWLTMGFDEAALPVLVEGVAFVAPSERGANPVAFPADEGDLRLAGFTWPGNTDRLLRGAAWAVVEPFGRGQVVLFQTDPNHRLVWRATSRLFANALLLGPTLGAR